MATACWILDVETHLTKKYPIDTEGGPSELMFLLVAGCPSSQARSCMTERDSQSDPAVLTGFLRSKYSNMFRIWSHFWMS